MNPQVSAIQIEDNYVAYGAASVQHEDHSQKNCFSNTYEIRKFLFLNICSISWFIHSFDVPKELGGTIVDTYCRKNTIARRFVISKGFINQ